MTELDLYKFVSEHDIEYHWINKKEDVILFIPVWLCKDWMELLGSRIMDEDGIECNMKDKYFCFQMKEICDYFGIWELKNVFKEDKE